jgi:hypothetical protein
MEDQGRQRHSLAAMSDNVLQTQKLCAGALAAGRMIASVDSGLPAQTGSLSDRADGLACETEGEGVAVGLEVMNQAATGG